MLICPECKFENPDTNKFCQNCGTSLTHKVCSKCGASVATNVRNCDNCSADCGTYWLAIISWDKGLEWETKQTSSPPPLLPSPFLDSQQRYQLVDPLPSLESLAGKTEICVRVMDCQPFQVSPLSVLLATKQQALVDNNRELAAIPQLARPYIALQQAFVQGIPLIHDAWQDGDLQIILIEDREKWLPLLSLWQNDSTSSLQIVDCFYKMTLLWEKLQKVNCRQSLLELENLRLDEDQTVALQRLYVEKRKLQVIDTTETTNNIDQETTGILEPALNIQSLGRIWQALFRYSQRTQFGSLLQLLGDVESGKIQTTSDLRGRLSKIASDLQGDSQSVTTALVSPDVEEMICASTMIQSPEPEDSMTSDGEEMATIVLPMQLISLEDAGCTDVGQQRHHNEDYFGIDTKVNKVELPRSKGIAARGLYILCDGMGGHAGGDVASELAVSTLRHYFQTHWVSNQLPSEEVIRQGVIAANKAIFDVNQKDARSGVGRMGTTLVLLLIQDTKVAAAHVGDSRLYRLTKRRGLEQISVDHEVGQREIARGVEPSIAYARPDAYQLTQALGPRDEAAISPDVQFFEMSEDTLFLLASDGLSDNDLLENHWQEHLAHLLGFNSSLETGVKNLIDLANQFNGHDNITAVLVRARVRPELGVRS